MELNRENKNKTNWTENWLDWFIKLPEKILKNIRHHNLIKLNLNFPQFVHLFRNLRFLSSEYNHSSWFFSRNYKIITSTGKNGSNSICFVIFVCHTADRSHRHEARDTPWINICCVVNCIVKKMCPCWRQANKIVKSRFRFHVSSPKLYNHFMIGSMTISTNAKLIFFLRKSTTNITITLRWKGVKK